MVTGTCLTHSCGHVLADGHRHLLDAGLAHHPAGGHRDLLDALLGDHLAGGDRHLLADGVRDLLADGHRHLLADDLRLVDRAGDVLDDRPRAADRLLAPGAGALVEAAVDADRLAGDVVPLDDRLVVRCGMTGLHHGPGHADRLADLAAGGLGDRLVAGLAHRLVRGRLDGPADRVAALLHDGLADRPADRVGAGPHLGAPDRDLDRVPAFLHARSR